MTSEQKRYYAYQKIVQAPGRFENEKPHVPYFWEAYLDGLADSDDGDVIAFRVTPEDVAIFPELRGRAWVKIRQDDQGFVVEVPAPRRKRKKR